MRAVVTGAGARVGRAVAVELARRGAEVLVHYRGSLAGAEQTVAACRAAGGDAWAFQADLADVEDCQALVDAVRQRWDTLDVLVNNASAFEAGAFEEITVEHWDRMMAIHARAPMLLSQGLLPLLRAGGTAVGRAPGEGGLVVHLGDIGAERPLPGYAAYSASKAALLMLVKAMAVELAPAVRTVGISPGQVVWPDDLDEARRARIAARIPMGRVGAPEDVARLVGFIATEAPYLNGVVIPVDGGLAARY